MENCMEKHTITLYVSNKPGVLIRVALVFARRGYNLDSLVVSAAHDPAFSRMTIVATGEKKTLDQILKQLNKLVNVITIVELESSSAVERELMGGGMSHVVLATEKALGRPVVVKVLPPDLAAGVNRERFRREIHLARALEPPGVVVQRRRLRVAG